MAALTITATLAALGLLAWLYVRKSIQDEVKKLELQDKQHAIKTLEDERKANETANNMSFDDVLDYHSRLRD